MPKRAKKRPFITVTEAIIAGIIIGFTSFTFQKPDFLYNKLNAPTRSVMVQEAELFSKEIIEISANNLILTIEQSDNKPTIVMFHTSWCTYCRQLLYDLVSLKKEGKLNDINLMIVSRDKDKVALAAYLLKYYYDKHIEPYILTKAEQQKIDDYLFKKGMDYTGGVPYTMFFDDNGNIISAITGAIEKDILIKKIEQIKSDITNSDSSE
ncbi:MAG: thioredoxin fold domain-containing protein [Rickettsiales bacterium]